MVNAGSMKIGMKAKEFGAGLRIETFDIRSSSALLGNAEWLRGMNLSVDWTAISEVDDDKVCVAFRRFQVPSGSKDERAPYIQSSLCKLDEVTFGHPFEST
mmetsp:Transcript_5185/g.11760  ORF Transcript_5185/g.11760 Transcript_5185/m.11760 type:complete len:101 (-) Transcript_5185:4016-4318(-)